jgi:hypothetical protein
MPEHRNLPWERVLDRILDDLRSALTDLDGEPWSDALEDAMNTAWDGLVKLGGPDA